MRHASLTVAALLAAAALAAQTSRPAAGSAAPAAGAGDGATVDSAVTALYDSVSHAAQAEPNWEKMRGIFLPVGMFVPPKPPRDDIFTVLDVDAFQDRVRKGMAAMKDKGEAAGFFEREVSRRTDCFGNVCQVFSTYESRRTPSDEKPFVRGINSIQLVRDGHRWWIASVVWDTERPDNPIPPDYLPKTSAVPSEYLKKN